jgi:hypothetical protein
VLRHLRFRTNALPQCSTLVYPDLGVKALDYGDRSHCAEGEA